MRPTTGVTMIMSLIMVMVVSIVVSTAIITVAGFPPTDHGAEQRHHRGSGDQRYPERRPDVVEVFVAGRGDAQQRDTDQHQQQILSGPPHRSPLITVPSPQRPPRHHARRD